MIELYHPNSVTAWIAKQSLTVEFDLPRQIPPGVDYHVGIVAPENKMRIGLKILAGKPRGYVWSVSEKRQYPLGITPEWIENRLIVKFPWRGDTEVPASAFLGVMPSDDRTTMWEETQLIDVNVIGLPNDD